MLRKNERKKLITLVGKAPCMASQSKRNDMWVNIVISVEHMINE
jgi:hypothetical protein